MFDVEFIIKTLPAIFHHRAVLDVAVDMYSPEKCQSGTKVELRSREGYLANVITEESGCGSNIAPWRVMAAKGQTIEIHLIDFSVSHRLNKDNSNNVDSHCPVYATIKEEGVTVGQTICGGKGKERHLYTSIGNTVEIEMPLQQTEEKKRYYILHYKSKFSLFRIMKYDSI